MNLAYRLGIETHLLVRILEQVSPAQPAWRHASAEATRAEMDSKQQNCEIKLLAAL